MAAWFRPRSPGGWSANRTLSRNGVRGDENARALDETLLPRSGVLVRESLRLTRHWDFLQGTSEKIHLHRFVNNRFSSRRSVDFREFFVDDAHFRQSILGLHLIPPLVEQSAAYSQVSRQPHNVLARVHSLDRSATEFLAVPFSPFSFHFTTPFLLSVFCKMFQSRNSVHVFADPYGELLFDGIVTCGSIVIGPESDPLL